MVLSPGGDGRTEYSGRRQAPGVARSAIHPKFFGSGLAAPGRPASHGGLWHNPPAKPSVEAFKCVNMLEQGGALALGRHDGASQAGSASDIHEYKSAQVGRQVAAVVLEHDRDPCAPPSDLFDVDQVHRGWEGAGEDVPLEI